MNCLNCGQPFDIASKHQPNQKYCCKSCADKYCARRYREQHYRDRYNDRSSRNRPRNRFYVYIRQPGQATWDGYHRNDYERYKHDLPPGTEKRFP